MFNSCIKFRAGVACVAGGIVSVYHLSFGGGAVIPKKKGGDEAFEFLEA